MKDYHCASEPTQPFPGLRPFLQSDEKIYFGRAEQICRMLGRLEDHRFLAVVGGSGSGKSSLVRAGLLPTLRQGYLLGAGTEWTFITMKPGDDPFNHLAKEFLRAVKSHQEEPDLSDITLAQERLQSSPNGFLDVLGETSLDKEAPLLLLVDQFEEIFRFRHRMENGRPDCGQRPLHEERNEAIAFVNILLTTVETASQMERPIYVVITMRSDFIGDCEAFAGLPQAVSDSQFLVPLMTREQMQEAIVKPLSLFDCGAEPAMVNQIINDAGSVPDQLPLMQHALMRTWFAARQRWAQNNEEPMLTLLDYERVGRLSQALSQHLEEAFDLLEGDREELIAQRLFLCMSERTGDGALVRRAVTVAEVAQVANVTPEEVIKVVRVFQADERNFIVATSSSELGEETVLDISHEALLRQWERLRAWLEAESQSAQTYRRLADTAALHANGKASLWRDPDLQLALDWFALNQPTKAWAARYHTGFSAAMDFLTRSSETCRDEQKELERNRQEERKLKGAEERARRLRKYTIGMAAVAVGAFGLGGFAVLKMQEAQTAQARSFASSARALLSSDPQGAGVYSLAAMDLLPDDSGESVAVSATLWKAALKNFQQNWQAGDPIKTDQGTIYTLLRLNNGELVSGGSDGSLQRWQEHKRVGKPIETGQGWVMSLVELKHGRQKGELISGGVDGSLQRWREGKKLGAIIQTGQGTVTTLVERRNGELISSGLDGSLRFWGWRKGRLVEDGRPIQSNQGGVVSLVELRTGALISVGADGSLRFWDKGKPVGQKIQTGQGGATGLAELPNGQLISSGADGSLRYWSWSLGTLAPEGDPIQSDQGRLMSLVALQNGELISVGADGSLQRWRDGKPVGDGQPLFTGQGGLTRLVELGNGELISGGGDGLLRRWRYGKTERHGQPDSLPKVQGEVRSLLALQNPLRMDVVISGGADGSLQRWRDGSKVGKPIRAGQGGITSLAELENGELISGGNDGTLQRWRWRDDGSPIGNGRRQSGQGTVFSLVKLKNGELISGGSDGSLRRWRDLHAVGEKIPTAQNAVISLVELENGELISGGGDGSLRRWRDGKPVGEPIQTKQKTVISLVALKNGELISGGGDGSLRRWRDFHAVGDKIPTGQGWVRSLVKLENGELISGGADGSLRRWRDGRPVGDGKPIQTGQGQVISLAALQNGELISGGPDGSLWWMRPEALFSQACRQLRTQEALRVPKTEEEKQASAACTEEAHKAIQTYSDAGVPLAVSLAVISSGVGMGSGALLIASRSLRWQKCCLRWLEKDSSNE